MPRNVRCGLIQARNVLGPDAPLPDIKKAMIDRHVVLVEEAARLGAKALCLQELFYGPYFCAEQETRWYHLTERVPEGPTVRLMCELARTHGMVLVVPIYEEEQPGVYYNTAAVIDADGRFLGKYRKTHIPHCKPGFWEKFYFRPGNLGYPVFETAVGRIGVYICYDRHFPEGARALGLNGAEIVFNPSATVAACPNTCGSWSSRRTRWRTATSSARSTAWASRRPGTSASSTARATSAIRAARLSRRRRATRITCSSRISTWI